MADAISPQPDPEAHASSLYRWSGPHEQREVREPAPGTPQRAGDDARARLQGDADLSKPNHGRFDSRSPIDVNSTYTVKPDDCLSTIAARVIRSEGGHVNAASIRAEVKHLVELNQDQYKSLRHNQNRIVDGWQLRLTDGSEPAPRAQAMPRPETSREPVVRVAPEAVPDRRVAPQIPEEAEAAPVGPRLLPPPPEARVMPTPPELRPRPYYHGRETTEPRPAPRRELEAAPLLPRQEPPANHETRVPHRRAYGPGEETAPPQPQGRRLDYPPPQPQGRRLDYPPPPPRDDQGPPILGPILKGIGTGIENFFRSVSDRRNFYINQMDAGYQDNGCVPMSWAMANADWNTGHAPTQREADYWVSQVPKIRRQYQGGIRGIAVNLHEKAGLETKAYENNGRRDLLGDLEAELSQGHTAILSMPSAQGHYAYIAGMSKDNQGHTVFIMGDSGRRARQVVSEQEMNGFLHARFGFAAMWRNDVTAASSVEGTAANRMQRAIAQAQDAQRDKTLPATQ